MMNRQMLALLFVAAIFASLIVSDAARPKSSRHKWAKLMKEPETETRKNKYDEESSENGENEEDENENNSNEMNGSEGREESKKREIIRGEKEEDRQNAERKSNNENLKRIRKLQDPRLRLRQKQQKARWMAEHGLGEIIKRQNLLRATKDRKLRRAMIEEEEEEEFYGVGQKYP